MVGNFKSFETPDFKSHNVFLYIKNDYSPTLLWQNNLDLDPQYSTVRVYITEYSGIKPTFLKNPAA